MADFLPLSAIFRTFIMTSRLGGPIELPLPIKVTYIIILNLNKRKEKQDFLKKNQKIKIKLSRFM